MPNNNTVTSRPLKLTFFAVAIVTLVLIFAGIFLSKNLVNINNDATMNTVSESTSSVFDNPALQNVIATPKELYDDFRSLDSAQFPIDGKCEYKDFIVKVLGNSKDQSVLKLFLNGKTVYMSNFLTNSPSGVFENASDGTLYYMTVSKCENDNYYANLYSYETATFDRASEGLVVFKDKDGKKMGVLFSDGLPVFEVETTGGFNKIAANVLKSLKSGDSFSYALIPPTKPMPLNYQDGDKLVTLDVYPTVFDFGSILIKSENIQR